MKINKTEKLVEEIVLEDVAEDAAADEAATAALVDELADEEMAIDDVNKASADDIADSVQVAGAVASKGEETFTDANAKKVAQEIKTAAKGLDHTAWAPLDVTNELTDMLDFCLAQSMAAKKAGRRDGVDVLVTGLPGSGKTGITSAWAEDRNVNLFYLNAKNRELDAILNGFPVDTVDSESGKHKVVKSRSTILDPLEEPNSILFLDEFNRAPEDLRAILLTLINEHEIEGEGKRGKYRFENLLFTVACVNPSVPSDPGAMELFDAEKSRFVAQMDYDSTKVDALNYIPFYIQKTISKLDKNDEDYPYLFAMHQRMYNLAKRILTHRKFNFDTRQDLGELAEKGATMLNQRELTNAIMAFGKDKDTFLRWVDKFSKLLDKNKAMFHEILDNWTEPAVNAPSGSTVDTAKSDASDSSSEPANAFGGDFDSIFGSGGSESDIDLFGNATSSGVSTVSAAEAKQRLDGFDFTL